MFFVTWNSIYAKCTIQLHVEAKTINKGPPQNKSVILHSEINYLHTCKIRCPNLWNFMCKYRSRIYLDVMWNALYNLKIPGPVRYLLPIWSRFQSKLPDNIHMYISYGLWHHIYVSWKSWFFFCVHWVFDKTYYENLIYYCIILTWYRNCQLYKWTFMFGHSFMCKCTKLCTTNSYDHDNFNVHNI